MYVSKRGMQRAAKQQKDLLQARISVQYRQRRKEGGEEMLD